MSAESDAEHQKQAAAQAEAMAQQRAAVSAVAQAAARAELMLDLAALRGAGVHSFKGSGIDVVFFAPEVTQPKEPTLAEKQAAAEMCPCGHHLHIAHDAAGACVEGCTAEQCAEKTK